MTRFVFADGSARPVRYTVAGEEFFALCVTGDCRPVSEADYSASDRPAVASDARIEVRAVPLCRAGGLY